MSSKINSENQSIWNTNADYWDQKMGEEGNDWHRKLIAPNTIDLLDLKPNTHLLDIGCGNGIFARNIALRGIQVTAFDFAEENIRNAQKYPSENINYLSLDATNYDQLISLGKEKFDYAVANMVLMDIPEIEPMFRALPSILKPNGVFVFSISHPCFNSAYVTINKEDESLHITGYKQPTTTKGEAIRNQPELQYYFDRPLSDLLQIGFDHGLVMNGLIEPVFDSEAGGVFSKIPPVIIMRMRNK